MSGVIYEGTWWSSGVPHSALLYSPDGPVTTDANGNITDTSNLRLIWGEPSSADPLDWGPLKIWDNVPFSADGNAPINLSDYTVAYSGADASTQWNTIVDYMRGMGTTTGYYDGGNGADTLAPIIDSGIDYTLTGANCHTVANTGLNTIGIDGSIGWPGGGGIVGSPGGGDYTVYPDNKGVFTDAGGDNTIHIKSGGATTIDESHDPNTDNTNTIDLIGRGPSDIVLSRDGNDLHIKDSFSGADIATIKDYFTPGGNRTNEVEFHDSDGNSLGAPIDLSDPDATAANLDLENPMLQVSDWMGTILKDAWAAVMGHGSPLVLDLSVGGSGITLSSLSDDPVYWDIRSEGVKHASGWVSGDTGLLCVDLNSNGKIDDNGELFGDRPANGTSGTANGFQTLSAYDSNSDGAINSSDTHFGDLLVWTDDNHDGVSQSGELHTLTDLSITSIDLSYSAVNYDISGNTIKQESTFTMDGNTRTIADAWFAYDNVNTVYNGDYTLDSETQFLPEVRGYGLLPDLHIAMSLDTDLKDLVSDLAGKTASELFDPEYHLVDKITAIMYQWAGVQAVDPSDRGDYFDAQKLGFLEHLMDQPLWADAGSYPGSTVLPYLKESWNDAFSLVATNLLAQTGLSNLLGNPYYDQPTDTLRYGDFTDPTILRFVSPFAADTAMYDSTFNDIYVFQAGDAPASGGGVQIWEPTSQGTDTILLGGVDPGDVKMWDDNYGQLHIDYTSTDEIIVENGTYSGSTGVSLGSIEQIMFDDGTTWDITQGLHLTASSGFSDVYGTAHGDTLEGTSSWNRLYGFGGNDTLISHGGGDLMYGGAGSNTYVVTSSGETIYQSSDGSASISGITAGKTWNDTSGNLYFGNDDKTVIYVTVADGDYNSTTGFTSYVSDVTFTDTSTMDMSAGLHLVNANTGGSLYGTSYADTLEGGSGGDSLNGFGGNDLLIGHAGTDYLYGGAGNDTYSFSSGDGTDTVHESASSGTDTILLHGIDPADVKMWDDGSGNLIIKYTSSDQVTIADGSYNSTTGFTAGSVEQIVFDDTTTWDLTAGLHLVGDNTGRNLYGTAYADTIEGGTGNDDLYGYGGNDTYSFKSGSGTDIIHEASSAGTDTIALHGISTGDVRMWTDTSGNLMIKYTSSDQVTVVGGSYNSTTGVTIGSVEHVVFDDSTDWDLTSGLRLGDASGSWWQGLYGSSGNDTLTSSGHATSVYGYAGDDLLIADSAGANSSFTGGSGADTFRLMGTGVGATITDFNAGAGDKIDIATLLTGYDPMSDTLSDFVHFTQSGSDTNVSVDIDGTGSGHSMTQIATLTGVTGLSGVDTLVANGTLIIA